MAKNKKKAEATEDQPAEREMQTGKLGHNCPNGCYNGGGAQLHWSKAEPGLLECPSCHETFVPVGEPVAEPVTE